MRSCVQVAEFGTRLLDFRWLALLLWLCFGTPIPSPAQVSEPLAVSANSHYFKDARGTALILNGSQTWNTFQDWGTDGSAPALDFDAFVKFLTAHVLQQTLRRISRSTRFPTRGPAPGQRPMAD